MGLGVDRFDDHIGRGGQKAVNKVRSGDRPRFGTAITFKLGSSPKPKGGRSSFRANHTTSFLPVAGLGSGAYSAKLLAGTRQRFSGFSQSRQWGCAVANIGDGKAAGPRWWRHAPAHHDQFAVGTRVAHDGSRIIWKHARHRRQVADIAVQHAKERDDGRLVGRDRIDCTSSSCDLLPRVARVELRPVLERFQGRQVGRAFGIMKLGAAQPAAFEAIPRTGPHLSTR